MKNILKNSQPSEATLHHALSASGSSALPPITLSANDMSVYTASGKIELRVGNDILDADFSRLGRDLMIGMEGQRNYLVTNYFAQETLPALVSDTGKHIRPETVQLLAGDPAANQYAGPAENAASIGTIEKLAGKVYVTRGGEDVLLEAGEPVYQNDVIHTESDGSVGITFIDGSVFSLGTDARMTLDSLVYDPATGEGSSEVTVLKGMFKFISGDIAANNPGDMVVETPVATIGIRGTTGGGNVQGPGMENQFFLEPNADGTVGWFDITTEGGSISMNQPFMQVNLNSISSPPPQPGFTTPEALQQQFNSINSVLPHGRYDDRPDVQSQQDNPAAQPNASESQEGAPESSELLNTESNEPQAPEGEQTAEPANAGETTDEGTNSDELLEVAGEQDEISQSGDDNFDGRQNSQFIDPTQNPLNQFIHKGDAADMLGSGNMTSATSQLQPPPLAPQYYTPTSKIQTQTVTATTSSNTDSYFQNIQDQIRVGNLPPDTLTNPPTGTTTSPPPSTSTGSTPPPTTTPLEPLPSGSTTTNRIVMALDDSVVETLLGGTGNDTFGVDVWNRYSNPNASNVADVLKGGAGVDKLNLLSHTNTFNASTFNAANTGIDTINFADTSATFVNLTVDNTMIDQSDLGLLTITGDIDLTVNVNGITDSGLRLQLMGSGDFVTLAGGTQAEILVNTAATTIYNDGSGSLNLNVLNGANTISLSGSLAHHVRLAGGTNTLTLGDGDDHVELAGGTQYAQGSTGNDIFFVEGGINHTLEGGAGNDEFIIRGGSGSIINGEAGDNYYDISGSSSIAISNNFSSGSNEYDIHNFSGIADITVFSSNSVNSDELFMGPLASGAKVNLTLDDSNGTTTGASLDFHSASYDVNTYQQSGNNLIIGTQGGSGGDIVLSDFFAGKNAYGLEYQTHDSFAELKSFDSEDYRNLNSSYAFSNVSLVADSISVTDGSNIVTVNMTNHGFKTGDQITLDGLTIGETFDDIDQVDVNGTWTITVVDSNTFTYVMGHVHTAAATGVTTNLGDAIVASFASAMYGTIADFGDKTISGAAGQVYIAGKGGNDTISGANDAIVTQIHGGDGNDKLSGFSNDILKGGQGNDVLSKANGATNVYFYGGDATDTNFDMVDYSNQANYVSVNLNTVLQSDDAGSANYNDSLDGIEGIRGTSYNDVLIGADGTYRHNYFDGGAGNDSITGGTGTQNINTVDYAWLTTALTVTLDDSGAANVTHAQAGSDTLMNIQNIIGGNADDSITGGAQDNALYGSWGTDTLIGGLGADTLNGGAGNDVLMLGNGAADTFRDVVSFNETGNGIDTVHHFHTDATITTQAMAEMQDAIDISDILHNENLHNLNYFDLLRKGFLQVVQNGANTDIKIDINGANSGGLTTIANLLNTNADNLDWKHFITSDSSQYLVNTSGSSTDVSDDIIVSTGVASIYANNGNDIIDIRASSGLTYHSYAGDDTFVIGDAATLNAGDILDGGLDKDTLVIDFDVPDFSAYVTTNITNFEALDLFGHAATNLQSSQVFDMTGNNKFLFVESSKAGASLSLDAASFTLANPSDVHIAPMADADASQYTTYVADVSGTEVYVHVNNNVTTSLA